jgi:Protein of unknown function (DUF1236)
MNKTLMMTVSVAALVAAGGVAFAQGMNEPRDKPAATAPAQNGKSDKLKVDTPSKTETVKPAPSAQLPAKPIGPKSENTKSENTKSETSGQGTMQPAQHDATPQSDRFTPKAKDDAKAKDDTKAQADAKHAAPAALSTEQHAKVWESVRSEKAERHTGAKFSITVGEMVPQTVHLNRLPARVYEYAPQYRGFEYILVGDEILIVDPRTHRIVAVIAA